MLSVINSAEITKNKNMRRFGVARGVKCKTLFMSDEKKHGHHFELPLFCNMSKQFLAPRWGFEYLVCSS